MAHHDRIQELLENNKAVARTYVAPAKMVQMTQPNGAAFLILTCLDSRVVPEHFFSPDRQSCVMRNGGGRPTQDVIRTIINLRTLGDAKTVAVIHHTDYGTTHTTNEKVASDAKARTPTPRAIQEVEEIENTKLGFGAIKPEDFYQALKDDVITLRNIEALKGIEIIGMAYDLDTGLVTKMDY